MKIKLRYIPLIAILILGALLVKKFVSPSTNPEAVVVSSKAVKAEYGLKVIKAMKDIRRGETGSITIQGRPMARYTIAAYYSLGKGFLEGKQTRTADEFGQVTFIWTASPKTVPGTYLVTVSGDGKTISLHHTVIE